VKLSPRKSRRRRPVDIDRGLHGLESSGYRSRVTRARLGPAKAAITPPATTSEIARARCVSPAASAAANRYCCPKALNAPTSMEPAQKLNAPTSMEPAQKRSKRRWKIASVHRLPPRTAAVTPVMRPAWRPTRRIHRAAGTEVKVVINHMASRLTLRTARGAVSFTGLPACVFPGGRKRPKGKR
jgi:hypothetical protein